MIIEAIGITIAISIIVALGIQHIKLWRHKSLFKNCSYKPKTKSKESSFEYFAKLKLLSLKDLENQDLFPRPNPYYAPEIMTIWKDKVRDNLNRFLSDRIKEKVDEGLWTDTYAFALVNSDEYFLELYNLTRF